MEINALIPSATRSARARQVAIGNVLIGGAGVPIISGPCAVEPEYVAHARAAADAGASILRGCIHKPRTHPEAFQGMGNAGLELLDEARRVTGLPIVAEPLEVEHVAQLMPHVDALMIGARSMHNTPLLRAAGRSGLPVIVKRSMSATFEEWLAAARYVLAEGNDRVVLCERGIRTFETATRNTLDLSAIPVLRDRSDLPVIVDPSHAAGRSSWVPALAVAAVAAGADGLLVECHPEPDSALCDAAQAISPETLAAIVRATELLASIARPSPGGTVTECRTAIDSVDAALARLLERRATLVARVERIKTDKGVPIRDLRREAEVTDRVARLAPQLGRIGATAVMTAVIDACVATAEQAAADLTNRGDHRAAGAAR
jgi:3-deoxy-7-phosphoheptulonate synthase